MKRRQASSSGSDFAAADRAAKFILARTKLRPKIGLVLGSGLGAFADELFPATQIDYRRIPGFPRSTAIGHAGRLVIGRAHKIPVAVMQGRVHLYEGYSAQQVAFPIRVFARMGIRTVVLTNAAGGINRNFNQGALVAIRDHINLQCANPLTGANDERFGPRFPDMTHAYSHAVRKIALEESKKLGMVMHEGVYAGLAGPNYETPAEIRFLEKIGADLVGMSTVPEVIAARHAGMEVLGISCVTNMAAGILDAPLDHKHALKTGEQVMSQFVALLRAILSRLESAK
jgi:purine-nucleoside phosphorylase